MKWWVFCCLVIAATARPSWDIADDVEYYENHNNGTGHFKYGFREKNAGVSTSIEAQGDLTKVTKEGKETTAVVTKGGFEFYIYNKNIKTGKFWDLVKVNYVADEKGYHPQVLFLPNATGILSTAIDPRVQASLLG